MKIRADFVTNSSSVSYILTLCDEMVDVHMRFYSIEETNPVLAKIVNMVREDIQKTGTRVYLEGKDIMTKRVSFSTDEVTLDDFSQSQIEEMSDEDLWSYILGKYIMEGKLSGFMGFGITQVETY